LSLLQAWLAKSGLNVKTLGLFALVMFPYTWKFVWRRWTASISAAWAPARLDGADPAAAAAGHRRHGHAGSADRCQHDCLHGLGGGLPLGQPGHRHRRLPPRDPPEAELGLGSAIHVNAYKLSGMVPGALSLVLADQMPWPRCSGSPRPSCCRACCARCW
jgi:PAT family beta-lactamase induction signal transducer AmpG